MENGSSLDLLEAKTFTESHGNGDCLIEDRVGSPDHDSAKQKSLFSQQFSVYLEENCSRGNVRPAPVILGDGHLLDLYQIFSLVKEKGGYDAVSRKGLWYSVIIELGLDLHVLASVKLVYDKYLRDFEGWLSKTKRVAVNQTGDGSSLDLLEAKTFTESHGNGDCLIEGRVGSPDHDSAKQKSLFSQQFSVYLEENCSRGNVRPVILGDGQLLDLYQLFSLVKEKGGYDAVSRKGLWYSVIIELGLELHVLASVKLVYDKYLRDFDGWLSKTKRVVVNQTGDGSLLGTENLIDKLPNFHMNAEPLPNFLAVRKNAEPNSGSSSQKVKMHPAVYEDPVGYQGTTELRRSKRRRISSKSRCTGCNSNSCSANGNGLHCSVNMAAKPDATEKKKSAAKPKSTKKKTSKPSFNDFPVKRVSVGPGFQAEVPQWTGEISESDSKWLGTQVWTVKDDSEPTPETDIVGRGRQGKCSCDIQGSVECVRFLIAGNRMKLKLELGSAFYQMGFDKMGEEVSLQWTAAEEKKFKDAMRLHIPSQNKSFWNNPSIYFHKKTRKDMVSYYFNAYIIQLRSYQNRVTPKTVDSDDDEVEFGSFDDKLVQG